MRVLLFVIAEHSERLSSVALAGKNSVQPGGVRKRNPLRDEIQVRRVEDSVSNARVDRMLEVVRGTFRAAHREWGWLEAVPATRMLPGRKRRIGWLLEPNEADELLQLLQIRMCQVGKLGPVPAVRRAVRHFAVGT